MEDNAGRIGNQHPWRKLVVLVKESPSRPAGRRFSLLDQARAWSVILTEEFGVPFAFYPPDGAGEPVWAAEGAPSDPPGRLSASGPARVLALDGGRYQLALLLYDAGRPALVAVGEVAGVAPAAGPASAREQARLQ